MMDRNDVLKHADAMRAIASALRPFRPEEQLVMIAGELGNVLCRLGPEPSRHTAVCMIGTALEMAIDMINRHFEPVKFDA